MPHLEGYPGIKGGYNINNFSCADDTVLIAQWLLDIEEEITEKGLEKDRSNGQ